MHHHTILHHKSCEKAWGMMRSCQSIGRLWLWDLLAKLVASIFRMYMLPLGLSLLSALGTPPQMCRMPVHNSILISKWIPWMALSPKWYGYDLVCDRVCDTIVCVCSWPKLNTVVLAAVGLHIVVNDTSSHLGRPYFQPREMHYTEMVHPLSMVSLCIALRP